MVQVRLLGPVGVGAGGEVPLGGGRQQALFAMLAAHTPPRRTDDQIVEGLWGDDPPVSARNAVQVYVSGLRKALAGVGVQIVRDGDGYALTGAPLQIDGIAFETAVAQGRSALRAGDPAAATGHLGAALALWSGEPLDGLGDIAFAAAIRQHLTTTRRTATLELSTAMLRSGRYDDAVDVALGLLEDHPYDERAWINLATAHYWAGRQDEALAACRHARDTLAGELGVDPSPELSAVELGVLRHELANPVAVTATPEAEDAETPDAEHTLPPLPDHMVGRGRAVEDVLALLADGARLVTLTGIGGMGKTTLATAVGHRLRSEGATVHMCELSTETETAPALDAVCRSLGQEPGDDPAATIAASAPQLLVLDNLEQIDGLGEPLTRILQTATHLTIIATSRRPLRVNGEYEYTVPPLASAGDLGTSAAEELFRARARRLRADADSAAVRELVTLLDGIPLAIELAAGRVRSQSPARLAARISERRAEVLDLTDGVGRPARQQSLRVVLEAAVDAVGAAGHAALAALAWCDGWLSRSTLDTALGDSSPDVDPDAALEELVACSLITDIDDDRVRLSVPVREFVRERGVDPGVCAVVVERVERLGPELSREHGLSAFARLTADGDAIVTLLSHATRDASSAASGARALISLRRYWLMTSRLTDARRWIADLRGSALLDELTDARLAVLDGTIMQWLGLPDAAAALADALTRAQRLGAASEPLIVAGWCNVAAGAATEQDAETARTALDRASAEAVASQDPDLLAMIDDLRGFVASQLGDHAAAVEARLVTLARARHARDDNVLIEQLTGLAEDLLEVGRDDASLAAAREAFDRMASMPPSPSTASGMAVVAMVETVAGDAHVGAELALEALRFCHGRYPSVRMTADLLVVLAAIRALQQSDSSAGMLAGVSEALRRDAGLDPDGLRSSRVWAIAMRARDRLGDDAWRVHTSLGAVDPDRAISQLLETGR